jgi:hypothetical protein
MPRHSNSNSEEEVHRLWGALAYEASRKTLFGLTAYSRTSKKSLQSQEGRESPQNELLVLGYLRDSVRQRWDKEMLQFIIFPSRDQCSDQSTARCACNDFWEVPGVEESFDYSKMVVRECGTTR